MGITMRVEINRPALARVVRGVSALASNDINLPICGAIAKQALIPALQVYPPQSRKPMIFVSERQRKAFFAKLRRGEITVPYRRTYRLREGWRPVGDGKRVENLVPYARFVQGDPGQARYHRGNWKTVTQIAREVSNMPALRAAGIRAVQEFARERGL